MPRRRKSRFKLLTILALILAAILVWFKFDYDLAVDTPVNQENTEKTAFFIKQGESAKRIAINLKEADLINDENYFYWYLRLNGEVPNILAGRFLLSPSMNYEEITRNITSLEKTEVVVTIQEGLRVRDIDQKLVKLNLIDEGEFIEAAKNFNDKEKYPFLSTALLSNAEIKLEGYLYPDTYFVDPINFSSEKLIRKMLNNFNLKLDQNILDKLQADDLSLHEAIIMASIIEKEVRTKKDMPIVAGILWKRLNTPGWTLGADATLLYEKDNNIITIDDLKSNSKYNTRKFGGLPPGPIANPSILSINASVFPEKSPYWFYLTTLDTGEVIYAKTNDEHNQNRAKYLR